MLFMVNTEKKALQDFYTFCLSSCSEKRLKKIKNVITKARKVIKKDLTKLKVDDVVKYLAFINQSDYKPYTKNDFKKIFKRFLKWYYKDLEMIEGERVKLGFKGVSKKRAFNKEKINKNTLLKPKELGKLLRSAKSLKWKALISLMYESAFRPCEIRNLKWKDCNFDDGLGICKLWTCSPKTKDSREVPVKDCVVHLKRWMAEYQFLDRTQKDFVFPSQFNRDKPLSQGSITEMLKRICRNAKIRELFPYMLRHTRIYEIQKRLGEKISAKFAGHSVETSEIYNHLDSDDVTEAMLQKVYVTEELTEEEKVELKELKKEFHSWMKDIEGKIIIEPEVFKNKKVMLQLIEHQKKIDKLKS